MKKKQRQKQQAQQKSANKERKRKKKIENIKKAGQELQFQKERENILPPPPPQIKTGTTKKTKRGLFNKLFKRFR